MILHFLRLLFTPKRRHLACDVERQQQEDAALAVGLLALRPGMHPLHHETFMVMDVYLPKERRGMDRLQWPISTLPAPSANSRLTSGGGSSSGSSSSHTTCHAVEDYCQPTTQHLASQHSSHEAFVMFTNRTSYTVRLLWVSYQGDEVAYDVLHPGESYVQQTFATHPWVVRELETATRLPINMQEAFCAHRIPQLPAQQGREQRQVAITGEDSVVRHLTYDHLQQAEITPLPAMRWSQHTHPHFPASFKAAVKTFLLCHHHLAQHAGATAQQAVAGTLTKNRRAAVADEQQGLMGPVPVTHLGHLPHMLLPDILGCAAPRTPQHMELPLDLRPDILPTLLPEAPRAA